VHSLDMLGSVTTSVADGEGQGGEGGGGRAYRGVAVGMRHSRSHSRRWLTACCCVVGVCTLAPPLVADVDDCALVFNPTRTPGLLKDPRTSVNTVVLPHASPRQ
jgi:hypothetical protein